MTKPLPTGCIKQWSDISLRTFNLLLEKVSLNDQIGYLYVVDIEFDHTKAIKTQIVYNEIYPPWNLLLQFFEKRKIIDPCERSVYQLIEQFSSTKKGNPHACRATKETHATLFKKTFQPIYLKQLVFVIKRAGWQVTKLYSHYAFEQERFKKDFILMNQRARQNSKNAIKKDFYKLMNNPNFGYDCHNNIDNFQFVPIFDELQ